MYYLLTNSILLLLPRIYIHTRTHAICFSLSTTQGGFFPLLLNIIPSTYAKGAVLAVVAGFGTVGILWIKNRAKKGKVMIYQRPELY